MQSSSYASLQAAYQEVHSFALYGGAGSRSVAANLATLKGTTSKEKPALSWLLDIMEYTPEGDLLVYP